MTTVHVLGVGAVSPAGWGAGPLMDAILAGACLPCSELPRPGWDRGLPVRTVPRPDPRPAFLSQARIRRSSPVTHFTVAAAMEALGTDTPRVLSGELRVGVVFCVMTGCVQYSRRFFGEVLSDPGVASPLLFPETVFNAPSSHVSALVGSREENVTVVGDSTAFIHGLEIAAHWIADGRMDGCLVIGAEEMDWLTADASRHFDRGVVCAEGSGALYLGGRRSPGMLATLDTVTDGVPFTSGSAPEAAMKAAAGRLPDAEPGEWLIDGLQGDLRRDRIESDLSARWSGPRLSPKRVLGEALAASAAWHCIAACSRFVDPRVRAARVHVQGPNEQAIAVRFKAAPSDS